MSGVIKKIWTASKKLDLSKEEIYMILQRETGKDSMRKCSEKELERVLFSLNSSSGFSNFRGDRATKRQLWKIRQIETELGWSDNPQRLTSFVHKYYKVESIEWLTSAQAWRLIESLKKVLERV